MPHLLHIKFIHSFTRSIHSFRCDSMTRPLPTMFHSAYEFLSNSLSNNCFRFVRTRPWCGMAENQMFRKWTLPQLHQQTWGVFSWFIQCFFMLFSIFFSFSLLRPSCRRRQHRRRCRRCRFCVNPIFAWNHLPSPQMMRTIRLITFNLFRRWFPFGRAIDRYGLCNLDGLLYENLRAHVGCWTRTDFIRKKLKMKSKFKHFSSRRVTVNLMRECLLAFDIHSRGVRMHLHELIMRNSIITFHLA